VCSVSPQGASLVLSFPKVVLPWTPSKSKPSPKFHLLGIYDNFRVYRAKLTFLRCFVPDYAIRAHGFLRLLRHDIPFHWDDYAQQSFDDLKAALSNAPLISAPDYNRDYILYVSASAVSVAGVLVQLGDDNHEHVIYYVSKNLSGPPLKYKHEEKLALAVVLAVQKLRHYILLRTTKVVIDSNPMQYLLSRRQVNGKFSHWIIILQEYDLEFSTPKSKKALVLAELVTTLPSTPPVPPSTPTFLTNISFTSLPMILGMATFSSTYELKSLVTTYHEMIVDVFAIRPPTISSSETSYIGGASTPFFVVA
jgi:hypothetical protein